MPSRPRRSPVQPKQETAQAAPSTPSQYRFTWRDDDQPTAMVSDANFVRMYLGQIFVVFGQIEWPLINLLTDEVREKLEQEGVPITPIVTIALYPEYAKALGQQLISAHEQWANTQQQESKQA